jgi:anthranilate/para-aminobenzoate synthase component I
MSEPVVIKLNLTPSDVLRALAEQPIIAALCGEHHSVVAWDDVPEQAQLIHQLPTDEPFALPDKKNTGQTWGFVPPTAAFVQLDYEFPQTAAQILTPRHRVWWNNQHIFASNAVAAEFIQEIIKKNNQLPSVSFTRPLQAQWSRGYYQQQVHAIRQFIAQGDCYQANVTMPFTAELSPSAHQDVVLFIQLLQHSPAPYAGFFRAPQRPSIMSHSPECFLAQRGRHLVSVPIKGTRRRLPNGDQRSKNELMSSEKERAELAMIVDLMRNDFGHVAIPGSVQVSDAGHIIELPHVHHRATRVSATMREQAQFRDVVSASFPAGSITGAPKIRAMQILRHLEQRARGPYCGAFGWMGSGAADLAVAIRTATIANNHLVFQAGGGIVWDSEATAEWDEVHAKASGFARAIGAWL